MRVLNRSAFAVEAGTPGVGCATLGVAVDGFRRTVSVRGSFCLTPDIELAVGKGSLAAIAEGAAL